jgi:hypothetical protein
MHLKSLLFGTALIFLASCSDDCDDVFVQTRFQTDKNYCIDDKTNIQITSIRDSRCPTNVTCVWGGEVVIKYKLTDNGTEKSDSTRVPAKLATKDTIFGKYFINITDVTPYPKKDSVIAVKDYRVVGKVTK